MELWGAMETFMSREERYRCYAYGRLSKEDADRDSAEKLESNSIASQRALIHDYIGRHPDLQLEMEGYDDGQTGTNFERPYFQEMIGAIRAGKVNCVIVKDLSRFGREYIGAGEFLEKLFPKWGVRFISIVEGYDTAHQGPSDYLMVPVKNLMNELYARDTSQKIRSALAARRARGAYLSSFAPYGYQKDPTNKNHLLPDDAAAEVVQAVFAKAAAGARPGEIAEELNRQGLSSPSCYRRTRQLRGEGGTPGWSASTVSKLLQNMTYLGHTVQGKTVRPSMKSKASLPKPPEEWVVVKHTHIPLVTQSCFEEAGRRRLSRACKKRGNFHNWFSGLARCADCGHGMSSVGTRRKGAAADLACGAYKLGGKTACTNHFIAYEDLTILVLEAVRGAIVLTDTERAELVRCLEERWDREAATKQKFALSNRIQKDLSRTEELIRQLYEDRQAGVLEEAYFYLLLKRYQARANDLENQLSALGKSAEMTAEDRDTFLERALEELETWSQREEWEEDVLFALLERIEVGQGCYVGTGQSREKQQEVKMFFRFQVLEGQREVFL